MAAPEHSKGIRTVIILFSVFSALLIYAAWYASDLAPRLMYRNYRTVKYAAEMQSALTAIYLAAANAKVPDQKEFARFDANLSAQKDNITEVGEPENVALLEAQWAEFRKLQGTPTLESFEKLSSTLEELTVMNEKAMFAYEDRAKNVGYTVLLGGLMAFVLVLLYAVQVYLQSAA